MWDAVARFANEIRASEFMGEMIHRRDAYGSEGVMGALDCATLYGLTRWARPMVLVESGGLVTVPMRLVPAKYSSRTTDPSGSLVSATG